MFHHVSIHFDYLGQVLQPKQKPAISAGKQPRTWAASEPVEQLVSQHTMLPSLGSRRGARLERCRQS